MDDHLKQLILLGREHYQKREFDKAEYLLRQVITETDRFADVYDMLGVIAHSKGDFLQAERHFEKAAELNPNYTEAQLNLMVTYNDLGKYEAARKVYAQIRNRGAGGAAQADPFAKGKIANMHAQTSQAYHDAGMLPEAIIELEKAVQLCPSFADLRTRLAQLYRDGGDTNRARDQLEAAKATSPNYVQARVLLGVLLLTSGETTRALEEFEAVAALDPENKSAGMYLRIARSQLAGPNSGEAGSAQTESTSGEAEPSSAQAEPTSDEAESTSGEGEPTSAQAGPSSAQAEPSSAQAEPTSAQAEPKPESSPH